MKERYFFQKKHLHSLICAGIFLILMGCASLNEGAVDYRYVESSESKEPALLNTDNFLKYSDAKKAINKGESISIHLQKVYMKEFSERFEYLYSRDKEVKGEIIVIAKAYELGEGKVIEYDYSSINSGRVVYYSKDVRATGQVLNFNSLPIYGPITYKGNPLVLELYIMELDEEEVKKYKALLGALIKLGSQVYPPASPILKVLDDVGGAFLTGRQDDIEFKYHGVLYQNQGDEDIRQSRVAVGDYVFVKQSNDRNIPIEWNILKLDRTNGILKKGGPSAPKEELVDYRDKTWLTIQVNSGLDPLALDKAQLFSEFYEKAKTATEKDIEEFNEGFMKLTMNVKQYNNFKQLDKQVGKWNNLKDDEKLNMLETLMKAVQTEHDSEEKYLATEKIDDIIKKMKLLVVPEKHHNNLNRKEILNMKDAKEFKSKLGP